MRRPEWFAALVFFVSLFVYGSNAGYLYTYDSAPNSLLVLNALEHHTLAFDDFRGGYLDTLGASYIFTTTPSGHLEPIFPVGTALLTAPIYLADYGFARLKGPFPEITAQAFEPIRLRLEKRAATMVAALSAALFFLCALRIAPWYAAVFGTVAFAFGSEMWTVGSQALWQHGSLALVTLAMIAALLYLRDGRSNAAPLLLAGTCAGFLTAIRPTAGVFSLAGYAAALRHERSKSWVFVAGAILGALPGILWNAFAFNTLLGGYAVNVNSYTFSLSQALDGGLGLLFSPNRGLLVYSPFVIVSLAGAVRAFRNGGYEARFLRYFTIASAATFVNYAFFQRWEGGATFGPRYLTELMPVAGLLAAYAFAPSLDFSRMRPRLAGCVALVLLTLSAGNQLAGANGDPKTNWSGIPTDVSLHEERVWDWSDSQILRDANATVRAWLPNPTFSQAYADGFAGTIDGVSGLGPAFGSASADAVSAGSSVPVSASLRNTGSSSWYGYASGLYFGQVRVRVRIFDAAGNLAMERDLAVRDTVAPGARTEAAATVDIPVTPGIYRVAYDIDVNQDARIGSRHIGLRSYTMTVRRNRKLVKAPGNPRGTNTRRPPERKRRLPTSMTNRARLSTRCRR